MIRVSQNYMTNQMINDLQTKTSELSSIKNKISTQKKIKAAHEDPKSMGDILYFEGKLQNLNRYKKTIAQGDSQLSFIDVQLSELNKYLKKIRDLTLQGANGIITKSDRQNIAFEVEQHLKEMVQIANQRFQGKAVFAGSKTNANTYEIKLGRPEHGINPVLKEVVYKGDEYKNYLEVGEGHFIESNLTGKTLFESDHQRIISQTAGAGYIAVSKENDKPYQEININGISIHIDNGDSLENIVDKINQMPISVKASIDRTAGNDYLILETTQAHSMSLEDVDHGSVLQDLGILQSGMPNEANHIARSAIVEGENVFAKIINIRDSLVNSDMKKINQGLGNIDNAIEHMSYQRTIIGNRQNQIEILSKSTDQQEIYLQDIHSKLTSTNLPKAIMDLKQIELSYRIALQTAGRMLNTTLLDVLK